MIKNIYTLILGGVFFFTSCSDLDLNPSASGSSETWFSSEMEVRMAINDLYKIIFWEHYSNYGDRSDDYIMRDKLSVLENGTLTGQSPFVETVWKNQYKVIARANAIIGKSQKAIDNGASASVINGYISEAHFHRACAYAKLVPLFGDVPLVDKFLTIEEALTYGRTDKRAIINFAYADFDKAAQELPLESKELRATKGAALAFKARLALYMGDWEIAANTAKAVMDLDIYKLHDNYENLFLTGTRVSAERIFTISRSATDKVMLSPGVVRSFLSRNVGGYAEISPSWDLLASYTCTDGLTIDKSPLFDPHDPFKNRDPRCKMTIAPFGEPWLGFDYNPHPNAVQVMNYNTGQMVKNNDTRINGQYASFNGLVWKKGIDATWVSEGSKVDPDLMAMRYAEVLLIYAEAKIELNQVDDSVLDVMNTVRARAYGVDKTEKALYPAFTKETQNVMRIKLRTERRVELTKEDFRYMDLLRWKYAGIVMKYKSYGMIYPVSGLITEVVNKGDWFWAFAPDIDENGLPNFTKLEKAGKIHPIVQRSWLDRQYLWPIPTSDVLINSNMKQNPGY